MVSLIFLLLIPALIGVAIYGVSLLFTHSSPKAPITATSPDHVATHLHSLAPTTTLPNIFSLVPTPSRFPELPAKEGQTPFIVGPPAVVTNEDDDDDNDDNDDEDDEEENDEDTKHKDGDSDSQAQKPHTKEQRKHHTVDKPAIVEAEKNEFADMSEISSLARGIEVGGIFTREEDKIDESTEDGESNLITSNNETGENNIEENVEDNIDEEDEKDDTDEEDEENNTIGEDEEDNDGDNTDEEDDINNWSDHASRFVNPTSKGKKSQQQHHHHRASQRTATTKLLRRTRIAIGVNNPLDSTHPKLLNSDAVSPESVNDFEEESKVLKPELTFKEIIAIARSAKVPDPVKTMYPLQPQLEKRKSKHSSDIIAKTDKKQASAVNGRSGKKETKSKNGARAEDLEAAINAIVDEQSESLERALSQIARKIAKSPELEQHKDILEYLSKAKVKAEDELDLESFTSSRIMDQERDLGQENQRILLFRNPKAVSRAQNIFPINDDGQLLRPTPTPSEVSNPPNPTPAPPSPAVVLLLKILNVLAPPFILQLRADLRNLLFWLCSPNRGEHIDGKDAKGDDTFSRQFDKEDRATLVHPDGSVDFKEIWDPRLLSMALECLTAHWNIFMKEVFDLLWNRLVYAKEFLIDQLRGLIGLPQYMMPYLLGAFGDLNANNPEPPKAVPLHPASKQKNQQEEGEEGTIDSTTAELESKLNMYVSPPPISDAFQPITNAIVHPSTGQEPLQEEFGDRPSQDSHGPHGVQRAEQGNDFVSWVVNMIFYELGFFFDAAKQAGALSPSQGDAYVNRFKMETGGSGGDLQCVWMKERVLKALKE